MPRPAEPGRQVLLDAALRLLRDDLDPDLAHLSVNQIVAEAGRSKGAFYQHWPDRTRFLVELHQAFHDRLENTVIAAIADRDRGEPRLRAGLTAYWDGCLHAGRTKTLLAQARHDPALAAAVEDRDERFARLAEPDLLALGWDPPRPAASLLVQTAASIAVLESRTRTARNDLRETLLHFVIGPLVHARSSIRPGRAAGTSPARVVEGGHDRPAHRRKGRSPDALPPDQDDLADGY